MDLLDSFFPLLSFDLMNGGKKEKKEKKEKKMIAAEERIY